MTLIGKELTYLCLACLRWETDQHWNSESPNEEYIKVYTATIKAYLSTKIILDFDQQPLKFLIDHVSQCNKASRMGKLYSVLIG